MISWNGLNMGTIFQIYTAIRILVMEIIMFTCRTTCRITYIVDLRTKYMYDYLVVICNSQIFIYQFRKNRNLNQNRLLC